VADILSGGPDPARYRRQRRWTTVAAGVVLAGTAGLVAGRSAPGGDGQPPPPSTAPSTVPAKSAVVAVGVGTSWAYALVSTCAERAVPVCSYRLRRRDLGGTGWTSTPLETDPRSTVGLPPILNVGADVVTVIPFPDRPRVYVSTDGGGTFAERDLVPGPPVDAVPESGLVEWFCPDCANRLTTLEPDTGRLRPLRVQPPLGGRPLRSFDLRGEVLWAAAADRAATVTAVSADRGRTWRTVPVPGLVIDQLYGGLIVLAGPDGGGYLLATRRAGSPEGRLAGVWRADRPGGRWRRLAARRPETLLSVLAGDRGLLVIELNGATWRLAPSGTFGRLEDAEPLRPGTLVTGPSRVLASVSPDDASRSTVLLSWDEAETWRVEKVT